MRARMKIAVAGATGRVGRHVVDALEARGHEVVSMSRSTGVDVITGDGLAHALTGVECIVDAATGPSPEQAAATEFFTTAARNLHEAGERAGVRWMVVVSIIGCDEFTGGYGAAKFAHERAVPLADLAADSPASAGPIPEIAGPRAENLVDLARLLVARRGDRVRIEEVSDPADPDRELLASGGQLAGAHATLAGPTFEEWLESTARDQGEKTP